MPIIEMDKPIQPHVVSTKRNTKAVPKQRSTNIEKEDIVKNARVIDDIFFEICVENPEFCEEFLQTVFGDKRLRIKPETLVPQRDIKFLAARSIRVDAYIELNDYSDDTGKNIPEICNIEIQRSDNCDHFRRARYNGSAITVNASEPGDLFDHVARVYVVYVTEKDPFESGLAIYHARMTAMETGDILDDGYEEIFINAESNDGTKLAQMMQNFLKPRFDDPEFPEMSKTVNQIKNSPEEVNRMCATVEAYAEMRADKAAKTAAKEATEREILSSVQEGDYSPERGAQKLNISVSELLKLMQSKGYIAPATA